MDVFLVLSLNMATHRRRPEQFDAFFASSRSTSARWMLSYFGKVWNSPLEIG